MGIAFIRSCSILLLALCLTVAPSARGATAQEIDAFANEALQKLFEDSPAARELASKARGILIFPRVWKAGFGFGAEAGEGVLRVGGRTQDYYLLTGGSFGLQIGVQRKAVIILFMESEALNKFRASEGWKAGVDGSVAIASLGAGASVDTNTGQKPIIGFVHSNKGLMYNLSLEGTKITRVQK